MTAPVPHDASGAPMSAHLGLLARVLQVALVVAFVTACGGAFIPGTVGDVSAIACVVVLIGAPALRVIWLTVGWARQGDRRFAALGGVLVAVVVASAVIAFVR
jgi:hypothetical protein